MGVSGDSEVVSKFKVAGDALTTLRNNADQGYEGAVSLKHAFNAALGMNSAVEGAVSLYRSFGDLEKIELRIAQAEKGVDTARAGLLKSQAALAKLAEAGVASGAQYAAAQLRVKAAEEQLKIAQERVSQSQGSLSQAQLDFALSVVPKVNEIVTGFTGSLGNLKQAIAVASAATTMQRTVNLGSIGSFTALGAASGSATVGMRAFSVATRLAQLAMGPVGIALLAVSGFMALFASNAFGIRDSINAAGKAIGDAIPILRPLLDMLGSIANTIFPQAEEKAEEFGSTAATSLTEVSQQYPELAAASTMSADAVIADYERVAAQAQVMQVMATGSLDTMASNVGTSVTAQSAAFGDLGRAAIDAGNAVSNSFNNAASSAEKAADKIVRAARKAADAMRSMGSSKGSGNRTVQVKTAATGFSGLVTEPTLFLAGEAGPETVNIAPIKSAAAGSAPIVITVITTLDGREVARSVSRHQAENL